MKPRVHRQRSMGRFIADFYVPKAKLIIEIDGGIHTQEKVAAKDHERTLFFKSFGVGVLRFTNNEVFSSFEKVCQSIKQAVSDRLQKVK
jgi:very-short-patch-repair endonuclease